MAATIAELLAARTADAGDRVFLRFAAHERSYAGFSADVASLAGGLRALEVGRGDLVAVLLPNCPELVLAWFALAHLGAVHAPVNTAFRGPGLRHALGLTEARVLVVDETLLDPLAAVAGELPALTTLIVRGDAQRAARDFPRHRVVAFGEVADAAPVERVEVDEQELGMLLFTSGTTGRSKACMLSHRFVVRQAQLFVEHLELRREDVLYCPFPLFHADAAVFTVAPALVLGATAALGERFSVRGFWPEIRALGATVFDFMGATLTMLHKQEPRADDAENPVRLGWGVPMPEFADAFERRFDLKLVEVYGLSDAGIVAYHPLDAPRRGACGRPVPPFEVKLLDEAGAEVPTGAVGEIAIRAHEPSVLMQGYFGMPERTLETFKDLWLHTGDLARFDADRYLHFVGRRKEVIRRRGENISAFEVEEVVEAHPAVREAAAYGVPSELTEEDVMVAVVLRDGAEVAAAELRAFCAERMARHMLPRYVDFVASLPRTPTEKVEKFKLVERGVTATTHDLEPGGRA
jgi:crotonobetaine/carnitine-CoA ligase